MSSQNARQPGFVATRAIRVPAPGVSQVSRQAGQLVTVMAPTTPVSVAPQVNRQPGQPITVNTLKTLASSAVQVTQLGQHVAIRTVRLPALRSVQAVSQ